MDEIRMPKAEYNHHEMVVGIPRSLLYFRYGVLWERFFQELGVKTITSAPTNLKIMTNGSRRAASEMCLAMKIYMGHVESLIGKCDYILVPRILDFGLRRVMCVNFEALPDVVSNIFFESPIRVLSYNIDVSKKLDERRAMVEMAVSMGFSHGKSNKAYKKARKAQNEADSRAVKQNEAKYKNDGITLVLAGHSYILEDEYIGKPIMQYLNENGVNVVRADLVDRKAALRESERLSPTLKWELSREIVGSLVMHVHDFDGVVLLSVYPCALDSMVNDMMLRKNRITHVPILQMTLDAQTGTAGVETRLESFLDILKMRKEVEAGNGREAEA